MELDRLIRLLAEKVVRRAGKKAPKKLEPTDGNEEQEKESEAIPDDYLRDEKSKEKSGN